MRDQGRTQAGVAQAGEGRKSPDRGEISHSAVVEKRVWGYVKWSFWLGSDLGWGSDKHAWWTLQQRRSTSNQ